MNARRELEQLRPDVQVLRTGPRAFRLLDPVSGAHFELGAEERYLLGVLETCDTVPELCAAYADKFGEALPERQCREFLGQLRRQGLLIGGQHHELPKIDEIPHRSALFFRLRGEAANVFFDVLALLFGWIFHPAWLLVAVPLGLFQVAVIIGGWDRVLEELNQMRYDMSLVPLFLLSYAQTICLLNLPLALAMGTCCRVYRGRVRSFGVTWGNWVLPTVSFFTDIGDSIVGMPTRGRRMQIALGILVPLTLGGVYAVLWAASSRAHDAHKFWSLMMVPCAIVALYQCNPFSIYSSAHWALASAYDEWRLHSRALDETKAWFWGRLSPEPLTRRERFWLRAYGVMHYLLRFAADVALLGGSLYLIMQLFGAPGAFVLVVLVAWWNRAYLQPIWAFTGMSAQELWGLVTSPRAH